MAIGGQLFDDVRFYYLRGKDGANIKCGSFTAKNTGAGKGRMQLDEPLLKKNHFLATKNAKIWYSLHNKTPVCHIALANIL